jgi:hypothetical protein
VPDRIRKDESGKTWADNRAIEFTNPSEKVGLVGSRSRAGRAAQAIGSVVTPGDLSDIRSPIRSTIAETLTPGGGRGLRRPRARAREREYRCPEGFQFGGRFTDSEWSTCGRQLFDLPTVFPTLMQIARTSFRAPDGFEGRGGTARVLRGQEPTGDIIKSRAAQSPRVGPMSKKAREDSIRAVIQDLSSDSEVSSMMVRRDGFPMQPVVDFGELRKVPDNRNMEEAAILMRPGSIGDLGKDELGLLSNTGVTSLVYVFPNGSTIRMDKTRELTVGERRKLGKTVSSASEIDNSKDPLARLNAVVSESGDGISLEKDFGSIRGAEDAITSGDNEGLPKWSVEAFKGGPKKRRTGSRVAPEADEQPTQDAEQGISNIENAIEHINEGGNLSDIDPSILMQAVKRSKKYKERKLGSGRVLFEREDGVSFVETSPSRSFEGIGSHVSSEIQQHLELPSGRVRLVGSGEKRPYLTQTPDSVLAGGSVKRGAKLSEMEPEDLTGILVSDYLTDVRRRSPASISGVETEDGIRAVSSGNAPSALAGLSADELKARRELALDNYLESDGSAIANDLKERAQEVRQQIIEVYDDLIQRARTFKWDNYLERLTRDGKLSAPERRHMEIVQSVYEQRLENLTSSRDAFAELIGISNE